MAGDWTSRDGAIDSGGGEEDSLMCDKCSEGSEIYSEGSEHLYALGEVIPRGVEMTSGLLDVLPER